jgi:Zn-dependent protease
MSEEKKQKTGIWALFAKLGTKALSAVPKFLKALKMTKVGLAAASFAGYSVFYSWKFALLLMVAVGFHESGHVWAMKRMGIPTKGFYFIPFLGGAAIAEGQYKTYGENAYISIMGPIWGLLMAGATALLYLATGNPMWAAATAWMSTINLFNLLPITPLDRGQLMRAIAFSVHKNVGLVFLAISLLLAGLIMWEMRIGLFVLILAVGGLELAFEIRNRIKLHKYQSGEIRKSKLPSSMLDNNGQVRKYPDAMSKGKLAFTVLAYVGTLAGLFAILFSMKGIAGADLARNFLE